MNFKFLTGDVNWKTYGGKFVSKKLNNGIFDYWLVLDIINWEEATGETDGDTYYATLYQVAPSLASPETTQSALNCWGYESIDGLADFSNQELALVELLVDYGTGVNLWAEGSNNIELLIKEARARADHAAKFNTPYLDRPQNALGTTGWSWLKGVIMAGL